jgi:hypothetical protein
MLSEKRAKDRKEMARQVEQLAERYGWCYGYAVKLTVGMTCGLPLTAFKSIWCKVGNTIPIGQLVAAVAIGKHGL